MYEIESWYTDSNDETHIITVEFETVGRDVAATFFEPAEKADLDMRIYENCLPVSESSISPEQLDRIKHECWSKVNSESEKAAENDFD